jgi:hypothetical protein
MKATWFFLVLSAGVFSFPACGPQVDTGDCSALLVWNMAPGAQILRGELSGLLENIEIEVQAGGKTLGSRSCPYEEYRCVVEGVQAGKNRKLLARAYGAGAQLLYRGTAEGVEVKKDQLVEVPVVMTPAYSQDIYPPAAIDDFQAEVQVQDVVLRWTAVGDDLRAGQADGYILRYSSSPLNDGNFDSASQVDAGKPKPAGQVEQLTVKGLPVGGTFYFGIKVRDDAGNISPLSNIAEAKIPG